MYRKGLYWFTHDLRLERNESLAKARQECDSLLLVAIVEPDQFKAVHYQTASMGHHRWGFLQDAFSDLKNQLIAQDRHFYVLYGRASVVLPKLIDEHSVDAVYTSQQQGFYESKRLLSIKERCPKTAFVQTPTYTLFSSEHIDSLNLEWPMSFSKFRRKVEKLPIVSEAETDVWPKPLHRQLTPLQRPDWIPIEKPSQRSFTGGSKAALEHWNAYRISRDIYQYKQTRNAIDDWSSSTKLSPWLNQGAISVRQIYMQILMMERNSGPSAGLEWIRVELLWREFFQWLARWQGANLFHFRGLASRSPLTSFYPDRFSKWTQGQTPWRLVNAIMNQLRETGYISNRARQIAASALVNELELDWRYGAAWFEHQLIDYDVNANWGNWQYIAGVGVDTKGGRHFNIEKQTEVFDPDGSFQNRWSSPNPNTELDTLDATGWPTAYQ